MNKASNLSLFGTGAMENISSSENGQRNILIVRDSNHETQSEWEHHSEKIHIYIEGDDLEYQKKKFDLLMKKFFGLWKNKPQKEIEEIKRGITETRKGFKANLDREG